MRTGHRLGCRSSRGRQQVRVARSLRAATASVLAALAALIATAAPASADLVVPPTPPIPPAVPVEPITGTTEEVLTSARETAALVIALGSDSLAPVVPGAGPLIQSVIGSTPLGVPIVEAPPAELTVLGASAAQTAAAQVTPLRKGLSTTGTSAVLSLARAATALLVLLLAAAAYLAFESVLAKRNPRLTTAPVDRREAELEFT